MTDIVPRLTDRQAQCLRLAADGYTDQQIATRLGLRVGTVKTHIKRARHLYGGVTRGRAAALAHRQIHNLPADHALPCCSHCAAALAVLVELRPAREGLRCDNPWARLYDRLADVLIGGSIPDHRRVAL